MKTKFLLIVFAVLSSKALCQDFLNMKKDMVKQKVMKEGGETGGRREINGGGSVNPEAKSMIFCTFQKSVFDKTGIPMIVFYFSNDDKCFEYMVQYNKASLLKSIIAKYDDPMSGYKRNGNGLKWIDNEKKMKIDLSNIYRNGVKSDAFSLDIYLINR